MSMAYYSFVIARSQRVARNARPMTGSATNQSRTGAPKHGLLRFARNDGLKSLSRKAANVPDDPGEIDPAAPGRVERLVDFLRMFAERRRSTCGGGRILRQRQVFHHQRRGKARSVVVVGRRGR